MFGATRSRIFQAITRKKRHQKPSWAKKVMPIFVRGSKTHTHTHTQTPQIKLEPKKLEI